MNDSETVTVLLVEDDPGDQKLVRVALLGQGITCKIQAAETAEAALDYLEKCKADKYNHPLPNIILLDLNMPGMGGREFLRLVKSDDRFKPIPVIVLTTSDAGEDIEECYQLQAAGYMKKSSSPQKFHEAIGKFASYWFNTSQLVKR